METTDNSAEKVGEFSIKTDSENEIPQVAIKNIQNDRHPGVLYDIQLANTLEIMKKQKGFS